MEIKLVNALLTVCESCCLARKSNKKSLYFLQYKRSSAASDASDMLDILRMIELFQTTLTMTKIVFEINGLRSRRSFPRCSLQSLWLDSHFLRQLVANGYEY